MADNQGDEKLTQQVIQEAADCFRIPEGTKVLAVIPEFFLQDELKEDPKFEVYDDDGKKTGGVKPCCPWGQSNKGVSWKSWECQNVQTMPRSMINVDASRMPLLGARYWCDNDECCGPVPMGEVHGENNVWIHDKDGKRKLNDKEEPEIWYRDSAKNCKHSFLTWNNGCFKQFPPRVRRLYSRHMFGLGEDGEPQNLPSAQLALDVLDTSKTFSSIESSLNLAFQLIEENAINAYYGFLEKHGQTFADTRTVLEKVANKNLDKIETLQWPPFNQSKLRNEFGPPQSKGIETVFWIACNSIKPYLDRDLLSRKPGRIVRWDGTFSAAKKMIDVPELDSVDALLLVYGEYGDVLFYAFAESEVPGNWQAVHYFLKRHCERMGAKELLDVVDGYDDLGSMLDDPTKHWFPAIWTNVERAPRKDPFHGVKLVFNSTYGSSHPMHQWFCDRLTGCLLYFLPEAKEIVASEYSKKSTMFPLMWLETEL